jgi:hypothetical protein
MVAMKSKEIILRVGVSGGDLTIRSRQKWTSLQNKYRLEDAQTPMISLIANDNWAEYTSLCGWI